MTIAATCLAHRCFVSGLVALAAMLHTLSALADTPSTSTWEPLWEISDEFNGSDLDMKKWENLHRSYPGKKPGVYSRENVRVRNGMLELGAQVTTALNGQLGYTVAYVGGKQMSRYGYYEVRAKPMPARINSAFWLYRWTPTGTYEVDVFEIFATSPGHERTIHTNVHAYLGDPALETDLNRQSDPFGWKVPEPLGAGFHTYGLEWNEQEFRFYFDNQLIRTKPNTVWHEAMYVRFTTETHPNWGGLPLTGELPAVFLIDYFRAWRAAKPGPKVAP